MIIIANIFSKVCTVVNIGFYIISVLTCFSLGCQPPSISGKSGFDYKEISSGYSGPVEPIIDPITFRYRETPPFRWDMEISVSTGGSTERISLCGTGSMREVGSQILHEYSALSMSTNDKLLFKENKPFITYRVLTDVHGNKLEEDLDFPGYRKKGWNIPQKGTGQHDELMRSFRGSTSLILPEEPIVMGSEIATWQDHKDIESFVSQLLPFSFITKNTNLSKAIGVTLVDGGKNLVVETFKELNFKREHDYVNCTLSGYVLININTGMLTSAYISTKMNGSKREFNLTGTATMKTGSIK